MTQDKKSFVCCEKCGKRLIERLPNGLFRFEFGRDLDRPGEPPVEIEIYGSIRIKCLRRTCGHINIIDFFPPNFKIDLVLLGGDKQSGKLNQSP